MKDIATANMDVFDTGILAKSQTTYRNILETLGGTMVVGREDDVCTTGHIRIGTATPEMLENTVEKGDIVILTNRYESQLCAIEKEASLLIICNGSKVGRTIQRIAEEMGVAHHVGPGGHLRRRQADQPVRSHLLLYDPQRHHEVHPRHPGGRRHPRDGQGAPPLFPHPGRGRQILRHGQPPQHHQSAKTPHHPGGPQRGHPGRGGLRSGRNSGDHRPPPHRQPGDQRPGVLPQPAGGLHCTIITQMYDENGMEIPPQIAGLLLAAILSDTLVFRSPTCTPLDEALAKRLAKIAGVDIDEFASEMFEAGEKLDGKTAEEVFLQDFKVFMCGDIRFGVAQGSYMTRKNLQAAQALLQPYLEEARNKQNVEDLYMLLTDVPKEESVVICTGRYAAEVLSNGFESRPAADAAGRCPAWSAAKSSSSPP